MNPSTVIPRVQSFEGRVRYMYKCTGGEVTIGFGHAIENPADAPKLTLSINGRPATDDEILADYAKVAAIEKGPAATFYANLTQCRMADTDIDALLAADITRFEALLADALPNWDTYPEPAQEALFDMAYNLGIHGLQNKFPTMMAAVHAGQWDVAAAQCHRTGIGETRNQQTAALFLQAAG
jgi:GH24 family phage-related lysozyme (muramidase)